MSLLSWSFVASRHNSFSISTCRKGSGTPPTLYSLLKPPLMITFIFLIRRGTSLRNLGIIDGFLCRMKDVSDTAAVRGNNHAYR